MDLRTLHENQTKAKEQANAESEVRHVMEEFATAIRNGNIDEIMSFYCYDIVAFDMMPPIEINDLYRYRSIWEKCCTDYFTYPIQFEFIDQQIAVSGDVAFCYSKVELKGTSKANGTEHNCHMRNTVCLRKLDDHWEIVHEHNSVPLDPETGAGLTDLKFDEQVH